MADRTFGNRTIPSSQATATNPSTATLVAELDSTNLSSKDFIRGKPHMVTWIIGGSTRLTVLLEHASSTGLGSTAIRDQTTIWLSTAGSAQYQYPVTVEQNDRLRIRLSSAVTGLVDGKIIAEPLS